MSSRRYAIYESLLSFYPKPYRDKYAEQMVQTLSDMLNDQPNALSKTTVWLRASLDLPLSIVQQNVIYAGGIMTNQTPHYVKRNSLISTTLILPFFVIVFSRLLQHSNTSSSVVFQSSLYIALILLPLFAFILAATTFVIWSRNDKKSLWRRLFDIRRSWILTLVGSLALAISLFVPFHDSVHCLIGNPVRIAHNPSQTWQCISDGFLGGR